MTPFVVSGPGVESSGPLTPEEWRAFIQSTARSITDPTFLRHDQGTYEPREPLP